LTQQPATPPRNLLLDPVPPAAARNQLALPRPRLVWDRRRYLKETFGHLGETALRFIEAAYGAATKRRLAGEEELF
jgi:hypothetical protein